MKKIFILILLVLFCSGSALGGEFENTLKKAEQGYAYAQYNFGLMYSKDKGTTQNYKQAFYWYKKAAEQGYAAAQYNLGFMYKKGRGVAQEYKNAYIWESLAAVQGHKSAAKNRDLTAKKITPQQLSEAQEAAAQMQKKIDSLK